MENEINEHIDTEISIAKVEKIDMKTIKFEQDRSQFYEKIDRMINDQKFINDCKKYLEIKNKQ